MSIILGNQGKKKLLQGQSLAVLLKPGKRRIERKNTIFLFNRMAQVESIRQTAAKLLQKCEAKFVSIAVTSLSVVKVVT